MTNPLSQYFRRPAVYIKLPSDGKWYNDQDIDMPINKELPVYPMTAIDEITTRTPDALFNGTAVVDIIKSCIPAIKNPWAIKNVDLDTLLIAIRSATSGDDLEVESTCPNCKEISTYKTSLVGLLSNIKIGDYSKLLELGDLKIKFKPLGYKDINEVSIEQLTLQKSFALIEKIENNEEKTKLSSETILKATNITMVVIAKTIEFIEAPNLKVDQFEYILDFLKRCDKNIFNKIRDFSTDLKSESDIKPMKIKCPHCNHEYEQKITLNPTDFFV